MVIVDQLTDYITKKIWQIESKISDLSIEETLQWVMSYDQHETYLETSLSLATEVGNSLLSTNSVLNQEIDKWNYKSNVQNC